MCPLHDQSIVSPVFVGLRFFLGVWSLWGTPWFLTFRCFVLQSNSSHVIYQNTITDQNSSSGVITHRDQFYIGFSCAYSLYQETNSEVFRIRSRSGVGSRCCQLLGPRL